MKYFVRAPEVSMPVVLMRLAVADLTVAMALVLVAGENHTPHIELAPLPASLSTPPMALASGTLLLPTGGYDPDLSG